MVDKYKKTIFSFIIFLCFLDIDNANRTVHSNSYRHQSPSPPTTAQQLESFVRQQVADHLARKRDWHSADLFNGSPSSDFQKPKRGRHM
jgi:hypothetical protein